MSMNNKQDVISLISEVFAEYCQSFDNDLNHLKVWPWTEDKTVIHEANQVHRFLNVYQKTGKDIVCWMELPVYYNKHQGKRQLAHIDAFIVDNDRKLIFFIEAKRFSQPAQVLSLQTDVKRLFGIARELYTEDKGFKGLNLYEYDSFMIPLADIWDYRGKWCQSYASKWSSIVHKTEDLYRYHITAFIKPLDIPDNQEKGMYHLLGALMPVFDAKRYKVELEGSNKKMAAEASIHVYPDNIPFEFVLALDKK